MYHCSFLDSSDSWHKMGAREVRALSRIQQNQGGTRALCAAERGSQDWDTTADYGFTLHPSRKPAQPSPASPKSDISPELPIGWQSSPPGKGVDGDWIYNPDKRLADLPLSPFQAVPQLLLTEVIMGPWRMKGTCVCLGGGVILPASPPQLRNMSTSFSPKVH